MTQIHDAVALCEAHLKKERTYNVEHNIWPSVNRVIDRMLARRSELRRAYTEMAANLDLQALERFLSIVVEVSAIWNPDYLRAARAARRRQIELGDEIHQLASRLATCLRERTEIGERSGFGTNDTYHVVDLIDRASQDNGWYESWVKEPLDHLQCRFDLKYWPSLADLVDAIGGEALDVDIAPTDAITGAATSSSKRSKADSFRAIMAAIHDERTSFSLHPRAHLSDDCYASILNVVLNLDEDELVDSAYIKRLRQRDRETHSVQYGS